MVAPGVSATTLRLQRLGASTDPVESIAVRDTLSDARGGVERRRRIVGS